MPSSLHAPDRPWFLGAPGGRLRRIGLLATVIVAALMWAAAAPARAADPVVAAAGDIACDPNPATHLGGQCHEQQTSDLLLATTNLAAVLPVGDLQYECGGVAAYPAYNSTWGRLKSLTFPVPGNHDYNTLVQSPSGTDCDATGQAAGYFAYFNRLTDPVVATVAAKTRGHFPSYYSYEIGSWHVVALNTNEACATLGCRTGSAQEKWLKTDLAAHPSACTLAYFHQPLFSSKAPLNAPRGLWQDLYDAGAEIILNGHVHSYERFAPQTPQGVADPRFGIREFVIGTGGKSLEAPAALAAANSEQQAKSFGILRLTLHATSYDWQFVPDGTPGNKFTESGTTACHDTPDLTPPTVSVTAPANGATVRDVTTITANAADARGVARVDFLVNGAVVGTDTTAPYSAPWDTKTVTGGSHTVSARAFDINGNQATASVTVNVSNSGVVVPPGGVRPSSDIFRVRIDGAGLRRVTQAPVNVDYSSPAWSRNGRLIAFSGPTCAGCAAGIFLVAPGGGGLLQLAGTPLAGATRPSWGRLDRALTFVGGRTNAVFTITSKGRGLRRLTSGLIPHGQSAWSPDGKQIAFTTQQRNGGWDILLMNANGSRKRNLTASLASEVQPAWAHDGSRIAFTRQVHGQSTIFVIGTGPGKARRAKLLARNCQEPAWSPNDRLIACTRFTTTGSTILIFRSNGTLLRQLATGTTTASAPTWSPDGRRIAFVNAG